MWVASSTRPDIAVTVSKLSATAHKPSVADWNQVEKVRRYLMTSSHECLRYKRLRGQLRVIAYSDAAFQNLPDAGSQGGFLVSISEFPQVETVSHVSSALIAWKSSKIKRVARSTFASETLQCSTTFDHAARLRDLFDEIFFGRVQPILRMNSKASNIQKSELDIFTDSQDVIDHLRSLRNTCTERRLEKEVHLLRSAIETEEVTSWQHIPSELMMADGMTKDYHPLKRNIVLAMGGKSTHMPKTNTNHKSVVAKGQLKKKEKKF